MAKYTSTSMEFFMKLHWNEGMAYFHEIAKLMQEEREQMEQSNKPPSFDSSTWHRWKR